jgi:hypothetical protein
VLEAGTGGVLRELGYDSQATSGVGLGFSCPHETISLESAP